MKITGPVLSLFAIMVILSLILQPVSALENSWIPRPQMIESAGRAVTVDSRIYAIGEEVQVYDPNTLSWTKKGSLPFDDVGGVAAYENKIYAIGSNYTQVYDVALDTWSSKTAMPTRRTGLQPNVVGDKIYLIGGLSDSASQTISAVNEAYNPISDTWETKQPIPTPVYVYSSAVMDNKIYIMGGSAKSPNYVSDLVQIYDPQNDSWTIGKPMPTAVRSASAVATSGSFALKRIYVIGGLQSGNGLNLNQIYDPETDSWTTGAPMPTARYNLGLAAVNDTIYAIGGVLLPPYAFPKEPLTTNEVYLPLGYNGTTPTYWQPPISPSPSPTATPHQNTIIPTSQPTIKLTSSPTPSISTGNGGLSSNLVLITIAVAATSIALIVIAWIIKRKNK